MVIITTQSNYTVTLNFCT